MIGKYQYSTDDGNSWRDISTTGTTSLHIEITVESGSGLPLGHENRYFIRVRAMNLQGAGLPSEPAEISLPATAPSKPSGVTPVPGNKAVTVTFTVDSNGPDLTLIEYSTDDGAHWRALDNVTQLDKMTDSTMITKVSTSDAGPLVNGVTYQLRLRATNELGTGLDSDAVSFIPAADHAGAPSEIAPTAGDRRITVTYKIADDGGSPITGVRFSTDGGSTWADVTPTGTGTFTVVITTQSTGDGKTPLVNGVAYDVRLLLLNTAGAGTPSGTTMVTPIAVPDAPGGLTATPAPLSGSLQFTAPGNGGSAINGWEYTTDGGTTWAPLTNPSGTSTLTATITAASTAGRPGLANGTTYQVAVRARNAAGPGAASPTAALTPRTTPGAPVSLVAAPRNRSAALTFGAPTDNGGSAVTAYQASTNNGDSWTGLTTASGAGGVLTATVADLANNTAYQVKVRAVTAAGPGAATSAVSVTPLAPPVAPTAVQATAHTATISVTWTASAPGGAPVTGYTAIASPGPATCDSTTASPTSCILGATADQPYTITVVAHSASGDSNASAPSTSVTAASPVIPPTPPPADSPKLDTPKGEDSTTKPGATMTIKGSGYAPNSTVELVVYSTPISLGTVITDNNGEFSVDVVVPPTLPIGDHSIAAVGADPQGNVRAMRLDVTVAPAVPTTPTTPPVLAITGGATADRAMLGLLMLALGAGLVRASRTGRWQPRHRNAK
jgi:titin